VNAPSSSPGRVLPARPVGPPNPLSN